MNQEWRYTAKSVTKYNPAYRSQEGVYNKKEWISFFQLGQNIDGKLLTFESYVEIESKYITAAKWFFQFHNCEYIVIKSIEKKNFFDYEQPDKDELLNAFNSIKEGCVLLVDDIDPVIKLILRELIWAELFCSQDESIAVRFGYDFYMYFNSPKQMDTLTEKVVKLGLFVR